MWFKRGQWLTHPCKTPKGKPHCVNETWICRCGRQWKLGKSGCYPYNYVWDEVT